MAPTSSKFNVTTHQRLSRENRVKKRAPRRQGKRDGPLQLRFLTATDPSHFKNEDTRRSVRSHAMAYHRNRPTREGSLPQGRAEVPATEKGPTLLEERAPRNGRDIAPCKPRECPAQQRHENEVTPTTRRDADESITLERTPQTYRQLPAPHPLPTLATAKADLDDRDHAQTPEERIVSLFMARVTTLCQIGDGVDPFLVLPSFKSPEVNSLFLKRHCIRAFASDSFHVKWLPVMLSHPHVMLSSSILASVWLDMLSKNPGDSKQTVLLKDEIIGMINERLQDATTQSSDTTIMVVIHLLVGEISGSNEAALRVHERGIAKLLQHRGGLHRLHNETLAETCVAVCYHGDLICEAEPLPALAAYAPAVDLTIADDVAIPESPLFCPRSDFTTIASDSHCSTFTCDLLKDMRDLTDLFISHQTAFGTFQNTSEINAAEWERRNVEYSCEVTTIRKRLTRLPSAHIPDLPTSDDWVYEACRIAALIYTASIVLRLPFSTVADPCRNPLVAESEASNWQGSDVSLLNTHLSKVLFKLLNRTNVVDMWNKMSGVFYWVSTVGAAAARPSAAQGQSRDDVHAKWVRRCLVVYSTRTMIKLVFDHAKPMLATEKKLLRVQELIGRYDDVGVVVGNID